MAIFTVSNLFDTGDGSLRQAIIDANDQTGADDIFFNPSLSLTFPPIKYSSG